MSSSGKFIVGNFYYTYLLSNHTYLQTEDAIPIVLTWCYLGFFPDKDNSTSCDVAHHFYRFKLIGEPTLEYILRHPTYKYLESTYHTWEELLEILKEPFDADPQGNSAR